MAGIFISYRRADSDGWAGRLRDALRARFGDRVFQDVESIADGEVFSEVIGRALQECDVALIIIGPSWANARNNDGRRLDQGEDWVRTETALVLNRGIRVIPVLVGGASMPRAEDLPEELRSLTQRQAREIRSNSWDSDVAMLTTHLRQIVGRGRKRPAWQYALGALAILAIGVFAGSRYLGQSTPPPQPAEAPAAAPAEPRAHVERAAPAPAPAAAPSATPPAVPPSATPPAAALSTPPTLKRGDVATAKPPPTPQPPKAALSPEPPRAAVAQAPSPASSGAPASSSKAPAPQLREPEPEPPRVARAEPPPAKAVPEPPTQESRKPAAETSASTATQVASLNLPNRPASARELKIGDSWTYRLRDVQFGKNLATVTHEISGGDKGGIRETLRLGPRGDTQRRLPLEPRIFEQQLDQSAMLFEFSPFLPAYSELQPGATWNRIAGASSADSINSWRISGKVVGRERVRVPGGSFDAIKAELEGQLDLSIPPTRDLYNETIVSYQTYTTWFAPEVGRAVKYDRRTYNRARRLLDHEQYELMSYKLQ